MKYRRRRRHEVYGLWDRWGERTHQIGNARSRLAETYARRRDTLADWFWARWDRVADRVGGAGHRASERLSIWRDTLADWFWARWDRVVAALERLPNAIAITGVGLALAVAMTLAILPSRSPDRTRVVESHDPDVVDANQGPRVPDVRGMSALDARTLLERAGLTLERATPVVGTPGEVVATVPAIGRSVPIGTSITLIVGVEAERISSST